MRGKIIQKRECAQSQRADAAWLGPWKNTRSSHSQNTWAWLGFMSAFLSWLDRSLIPAGLVTWLTSRCAPTSDYHKRANYPAQLWAIILVISQAAINRKGKKKWSLFPGQYFKVLRYLRVEKALLGFETAQLCRVCGNKSHLFSGCVVSYSHTSPINQAYA